MTTPPDDKPWMSAPDYGRSLRAGIGFNLLVRDVARGVAFAEQVLGATVPHHSEDFAAVRLYGSDYMLHHDRTYRDNALKGILAAAEGRGVGVELRVYGRDPDRAEAAARAGGWTVLAGSMDKPHGLRECVILDDEGYAWVPGVGIADR
jgi:catechol 2,3-dioxygenase-like lactoylglutathione lyase family enzyme